MSNLTIRPARPDDVASIMAMIRELAVFEKLEHLVVADEAMLHAEMFGAKPGVEGIVGEDAGSDHLPLVVDFSLMPKEPAVMSAAVTRAGSAPHVAAAILSP